MEGSRSVSEKSSRRGLGSLNLWGRREEAGKSKIFLTTSLLGIGWILNVCVASSLHTLRMFIRALTEMVLSRICVLKKS